MRKILTLLISVVAASPATAAPAYLKCNFIKEGAPTIVVDVTADEANGTVTTLVESTGYSERRTAVFSPTDVRWTSPSRMTNLSYVLSRTDLTLQRVLTIGEKSWPDVARCAVQATVKRAF